MIEGKILIIIQPRGDGLKIYNTLWKISQRENVKRLNICLLADSGNTGGELEKIRVITSYNHLLTLNIYLCKEADILEIMKNGKVYIVYFKEDEDKVKRVIQSLVHQGMSIEEVVLDEL
ncbi:MAG: hypothetical protein QXV51_00435 [Thermosphaera sp.]